MSIEWQTGGESADPGRSLTNVRQYPRFTAKQCWTRWMDVSGEALGRDMFGAIDGEPVFPFSLAHAQQRVNHYAKLTDSHGDNYVGPEIIDEPLPRDCEEVIKENFIRNYHEEKNRKDAEEARRLDDQRRLSEPGDSEDHVSALPESTQERVEEHERTRPRQIGSGEPLTDEEKFTQQRGDFGFD